jgi:hypothetical protein
MFLSLIFTATLFSVSFAQVKLSARDSCSHNNCLRAFLGVGTEAVAFCQTYTSGNAIPTFASNCDGSVSKVVSACSCIYTATISSSTSSSVITSKTWNAYRFIVLTYLEATSSIVTTTSTAISSSGKEILKIGEDRTDWALRHQYKFDYFHLDFEHHNNCNSMSLHSVVSDISSRSSMHVNHLGQHSCPGE